MSKIALSTSHLSGQELSYIQDALERNEVVYGANLSNFENDLEG
jgi:dTDP-4-amino-4,6-dideoxygalactose transaminase